jgi:hypothetical protein
MKTIKSLLPLLVLTLVWVVLGWLLLPITTKFFSSKDIALFFICIWIFALSSISGLAISLYNLTRPSK